jgi:hypothetical protein
MNQKFILKGVKRKKKREERGKKSRKRKKKRREKSRNRSTPFLAEAILKTPKMNINLRSNNMMNIWIKKGYK